MDKRRAIKKGISLENNRDKEPKQEEAMLTRLSAPSVVGDFSMSGLVQIYSIQYISLARLRKKFPGVVTLRREQKQPTQRQVR